MKKNLLNKKQIGFIKGCGTELNLLRLRQRVTAIKKILKIIILNMFYLLI